MIVSASRRTDIPAFYSDWFFNRIKAGYVDVRNPMNVHQVSRVPLSSDVVDCIVFWSKNPAPMLNRLRMLDDYSYYFQFTITPYGNDIERNLPHKSAMIETFKQLSSAIGGNRVVWRYDPILLSSEFTITDHLNCFEAIAKALDGYTHSCVISFIDIYRQTERNIRNTSVREPDEVEMLVMARQLADIGKSHGITVVSCSEKIDLSGIGIDHGHCIDQALISEIVGRDITVKKDKSQRQACGCVESIDIGQYNTCTHGCVYCYANFNCSSVQRNATLHDPTSPLLIGHIEDCDIVKPRPVKSLIDRTSLF